MIDILIWITIGAFIGWNVPQPGWAILIQEWITNKISNFKK